MLFVKEVGDGTLIRLPVGEEREVGGIELEYAEDPRSLEGKKIKVLRMSTELK